MHELIKRSITGFILALVFTITILYLPPPIFTYILIIILGEILLWEWPKFVYHNFKFLILTPFYPILPFGLLIYINHYDASHLLLPILFITVWSNDIGAYCIGKLIGKHKLAPKISPGKTWEGLVGGFIFCIIIFTTLLLYKEISYTYPCIVFTSMAISSIATIGDLFESWLKRKAGIKDTGFLLPGHGGFLDRFDSVLFVGIFFFMYYFFWLNS